jgi:hypothetical protein
MDQKKIYPSTAATKKLKSLLTKTASELPQNLGEIMASELSQAPVDSTNNRISVARISPLAFRELTAEELLEARQTLILLKASLQNLLQGLTLKHSGLGLMGRLDPNHVHKLFLKSPKMFRQQNMRTGLNAAIHLLIDTSGSMSSLIDLASLTAYSLCDALAGVPGVNVAATAFPGSFIRNHGGSIENWATVAPILKHGRPCTGNFSSIP